VIFGTGLNQFASKNVAEARGVPYFLVQLGPSQPSIAFGHPYLLNMQDYGPLLNAASYVFTYVSFTFAYPTDIWDYFIQQIT
jgi:hypothetical protein